MNDPKYMIENPEIQKRDRLAAFFEAFDLTATAVDQNAADMRANLFVMGRAGVPLRVIYCARGKEPQPADFDVLAAALIDFGGMANPLVSAMPEFTEVDLAAKPAMEAMIAAFVIEAEDRRCGRQVALDRLCELIVLMILREAVEAGTTEPGLLAGLSHPALHRAIVAIHDEPARAWRIEDLADICGFSRSRFMEVFPRVVGTTPAAYLTAWRLALGRRHLMRGDQVKSVARRVGFGSAAAFSRAYSRSFGESPLTRKDKVPAATA